MTNLSGSSSAITYEIKDEIGILTFNRPEARNALTTEIRLGITDVMLEIREKLNIKALVVTGKGGNFCAGGDIKSFQEMAPEPTARRERVRRSHIWLDEFVNLEVPVIGAVDGAAMGAGFSIMLACDFIFCTPRARCSGIFVRTGLIPDMGCLFLLPRLVGLQKARELLYTGKILKPDEIQALGLVTDIVDEENLFDHAFQFASRFRNASTTSIGITKNILNQSFHSDHRTISELEAYGQAVCFDTDYHRDAINRFLNKEPALFDWADLERKADQE
jgi:2-(1,2-epoxy-1,2-dihydrophenyl)acetyl-CoA isomerase